MKFADLFLFKQWFEAMRKAETFFEDWTAASLLEKLFVMLSLMVKTIGPDGWNAKKASNLSTAFSQSWRMYTVTIVTHRKRIIFILVHSIEGEKKEKWEF